MEKFWPSAAKKAKLQRLARDVVIEIPLLIPVVLSSCEIDDEILPATVVEDTLAVHPVPQIPSSFGARIEEEDGKIILHCAWEGPLGTTRLVVVSNDTDTVVTLLRHIDIWAALGLKELWVQIGTGEKRRFLPLHAMLLKLRRDICRILIKVHVITGDDFLN